MKGNRFMRRAVGLLYIIIVLVMGVATIVENSRGTEFVRASIYGAAWFSLLWGVLTVLGIVYFLRNRVRQAYAWVLHASFVVILLGALVTHVGSKKGMIHLRQGEPTSECYVNDVQRGALEARLPFQLRLDRFATIYHEGTDAAQDYRSEFTVIDAGRTVQASVAMNKIFSYRSIRFYQASFDDDGRGATLAFNSDRYGIPMTYTGYAMLFLSLLWMLFARGGAYRRVLRHPLLRKGLLGLCLLLTFPATTKAAPTVSRQVADEFGQLQILYAGRICPVETFALDFTKKLSGGRSYDGLTACQVLMGWMLWEEEWNTEPFIRLKNGPLRSSMQLDGHVALATFFNPTMGGYVLGPALKEYYDGNRDKYHQQVADTDDRLQLLMDLHQGSLLRLFPIKEHGQVKWCAPADSLPSATARDEALFVSHALSLLREEAHAGDEGAMMELIAKLRSYQQQRGGASLPSAASLKAEHVYNAVPFATILFMVNLSMGFLSLLVLLRRMSRQGGSTASGRGFYWLSVVVMSLSFLALTVCEGLRWTISGTIPMANGYETMLLVAWIVLALSLLLCRRFHVMLMCGFLMSGFFLLVSHIGQMDPQITHRMPVLNSPLLSVHVSVIMLSFALLSMTFICGVTALVVHYVGRRPLEPLQLLSQLFLYPAMAMLGIGIFIGAVWANVSWGEYWSWDPKEVWALITFMVYAVALHPRSASALQRPLRWHVFMVVAFLTILMTYFGVNYFLGGMHSYA